jgi:hypothetical protein
MTASGTRHFAQADLTRLAPRTLRTCPAAPAHTCYIRDVQPLAGKVRWFCGAGEVGEGIAGTPRAGRSSPWRRATTTSSARIHDRIPVEWVTASTCRSTATSGPPTRHGVCANGWSFVCAGLDAVVASPARGGRGAGSIFSSACRRDERAGERT